MEFSAVLWDMDGTLVDTEPYWMRAETELMAAHGLTWTYEQGLLMVGNELTTSAEIMRSYGLPLGVTETVDALIDRVVEQLRASIPWRPGARELLADLRAHKIPCALVTMSYRSMAEAVVAGMPAGTMSALITGDEVRAGKPDPEPYVRGSQALGCAPADCVAIEDSVPGLKSAIAAGTLAVAVPHLVELPAGENHVVLDSLAGVTAQSLDQAVRPLADRRRRSL